MHAIQGQSSLGHLPGPQWTFDEEVTACFHDMLFRSIPQLNVMRQASFSLGKHFVHAGDTILDLGCSLGDALMPFIQHYGASCQYVGLEISPSMLEACRQRFAQFSVSDVYGTTAVPNIDIQALDLRRAYPAVSCALVLSILTMMFLPLEYRANILHKTWQALRPGGAFLFVEKIIGSQAELAGMFAQEYHAFKAHQGYSAEEIARKALALEGVLMPLTARMNEDLLREAGFAHAECFWRWFNFAGWVAVK